MQPIHICTASFFDPDRCKGKCFSIARAQPTGRNFPVLSMLQPPWKLIIDYKRGYIDDKGYRRRYTMQVLAKTTHIAVRRALCDAKVVTLLCWEPAGKFCHRRIVADWLRKSTHFVVHKERVE